jgi:hypothetical protein
MATGQESHRLLLRQRYGRSAVLPGLNQLSLGICGAHVQSLQVSRLPARRFEPVHWAGTARTAAAASR